MLKSISKFSDFQFHWDTLRNCLEKDGSVKKVCQSSQVEATDLIKSHLAKSHLARTPQIPQKMAPRMPPSHLPRPRVKTPEPELIQTEAVQEDCLAVALLESDGTDKRVKTEDIEQIVLDHDSNSTFTIGQNRNEPASKFDSLLPNGDCGQVQLCINCQAGFSDQYQLAQHLLQRVDCQNAMRTIGLNYCFVCQKTYSSVSAQTNFLSLY